MARRRIITVGDVVRYKPTGHVGTVKAIYAGTMRGAFECVGGVFRQARAIIVLENDSGHYPVGDDVELLLPEDVDEEGRYPTGYVCQWCEPSDAPTEESRIQWCAKHGKRTWHRPREHFVHGGQADKTKETEVLCGRCYLVKFLDKQRATLARCSEHGLVWHYPEEKPSEGMEYVCKMCNPSVGLGEPTVMRWCFLGRADTPHVLVPKQAF